MELIFYSLMIKVVWSLHRNTELWSNTCHVRSYTVTHHNVGMKHDGYIKTLVAFSTKKTI